MLITYGLQFLDKALLGYAAVYSMREDTVSGITLSHLTSLLNTSSASSWATVQLDWIYILLWVHGFRVSSSQLSPLLPLITISWIFHCCVGNLRYDDQLLHQLCWAYGEPICSGRSGICCSSQLCGHHWCVF